MTVYFPAFRGLPEEILAQDPLFIDFLCGLLEVDPLNRLNAEKALQHDWLK